MKVKSQERQYIEACELKRWEKCKALFNRLAAVPTAHLTHDDLIRMDVLEYVLGHCDTPPELDLE